MSVFPGFYASMQKYVSKLGQFPFADNYCFCFNLLEEPDGGYAAG